MTLGLLEFRKKHGLSQFDIAQLAGVGVQAVSFYDRGHVPLRAGAAYRKLQKLVESDPTTNTLKRKLSRIREGSK